MKAVVAAFNQEKALVGAFSVIVQPVVEPMDRFTALLTNKYRRQGAAYIAYDAWGNNHAVLVERMTPDYHDSLGAEFSSGQISPVREAAMGISTD